MFFHYLKKIIRLKNEKNYFHFIWVEANFEMCLKTKFIKSLTLVGQLKSSLNVIFNAKVSVIKTHITVHISQTLKCVVNWSLHSFIRTYEICLSLYKTVQWFFLSLGCCEMGWWRCTI